LAALHVRDGGDGTVPYKGMMTVRFNNRLVRMTFARRAYGFRE
jgi:hypothetical protein